MGDAEMDAPRGKGLNSSTDILLNIAVAVLVVAMIAIAGWFGYSVWRDRSADRLTQAPNRVVDALMAQVRKSPNDAVLRVRLGEALGAARRYPEATEQLNAALKLEPEHVGAHLDLGMISLLTRNEQEAENYLTRVVELTDAAQYVDVDERREKALYNLGLLKLSQDEYESAAGYLKGALRIRKDASDSYLALAQALEGMGEVDGAIDSLSNALAFDPGYAEAHYNIGLLYRQKKDDINASYHFGKAAELAPEADLPREALESYGTASTWINRSKQSQSSGASQAALDAILVARNLDPVNLDAIKQHALVLLELGEVSSAFEVYLKASETAKDDPQIKAAITRIETDNPQDALTVYKNLATSRPSDDQVKKKIAALKKALQ